MKKEKVKESLSQWQKGFYYRQREADTVMHRGIFYLLVFLAFAGLIQYGKEKYPEWKEGSLSLRSNFPRMISAENTI